MTNNIYVLKFGGSSVGSSKRIIDIAKKLLKISHTKPRLVVVVSAMGDTTDSLVSLAKEVSRNPHPREYDALVSTGENISAALLAMALQDLGQKAISLTGPQAGIHTEKIYSKAKIRRVNPSRILQELDNKAIVIVTGFQGLNEYNDVTTIGRGGSDTSAVVLAAALKAKECHIYTDVEGVFTTDPRIVPHASKLHEISYHEMLELSVLGAKVLHPRAVECAQEYDIVLHVRSSFSNEEGTRVKKESQMEVQRAVTGVTVNENEAKVAILKVPDKPGTAGHIFERLSEANINVDVIIQSIEEDHINSIAFTVHKDDLSKTKIVVKKLIEEGSAQGIKTDASIAKISIVGVGMISTPGIAARFFNALARKGINIKHISTSAIKVSCIIDKKESKKAIRAVHDEFELDKINK
ncbi:MAG: aspartate kinase [Candidatus Margulisbacteria bacterium]|nr:aspartate kinase [Candidatus Margulisiibacteriota bacterium]